MCSPTSPRYLPQEGLVGLPQGLPHSLSFLFSEAAPSAGGRDFVLSPKSSCGLFSPAQDCTPAAVDDHILPFAEFSRLSSFTFESADSLLSPSALEFFNTVETLDLNWLGASEPHHMPVQQATTAALVSNEAFEASLRSLPSLELFAGASPSPSTVSSQSTATATGPMRRRRPKVAASDEVRKTQKYIQRRIKNNLAAARNREMKRQMAAQCGSVLPELTKKNVDLRSECDMLRTELDALLTSLRQRLGR